MPLFCEVIVIQLALLTADQMQDWAMVMSTLPVPPSTETDSFKGEIVPRQSPPAVPAWRIMNILPGYCN